MNISQLLLGDRYEHAQTYAEWLAIAEALDAQRGMDTWRSLAKSSRYNHESIQARVNKLKRLRRNKKAADLLFMLNEGIHGNMDGMANAALYRKAAGGTKHLIDEYVTEIEASLCYLAGSGTPGVSKTQKIDFFERAAQCFGSTALMLSGAGALGFFHLGVVRALHLENLLPRVISGSSAGSIVAAVVASRSPAELDRLFSDAVLDTTLAQLDQYAEAGGSSPLKRDQVVAQIEQLVPDMTFQEAFEESGRHTNITVSATRQYQKSRLLNSITSPNVLLRSAVLASCAVPGVYAPVTLMAKEASGAIKKYLPREQWRDGSLASDLPARRLSRLYGVNHYIASQVNPVVLWSLLEFRQSGGMLPGLVDFGLRLQKEYLNYMRATAARLFKKQPRTSYWIESLLAVAAQNYAGDINIVPRFRWFDPRKLLSHLDGEDRTYLLREGHLATWPHIARIRNSSSIALNLASIQDKYSEPAKTAKQRQSAA